MDIVILAAGLGTRMKSKIPKLLHRIFDVPIIDYVIETARTLNPNNLFVVINPQLQELKEHLSNYDINFVFQKEPKGTGNAVLSALSFLKSEDILILNGDTPLLKAGTISKFIDLYKKNAVDMGILSFIPKREHSYGRILRDQKGNVQKIVEVTDLSENKKNISEANSGVYLLKRQLAEFVRAIEENPLKKEYYFTDLVEIAVKKGKKVEAYTIAEEEELIGINTRFELSLAMKYLRDRIVREWMDKGVTIYDSATTWISPKVQIGEDTVIYPNVFIEGETIIGKNCTLHQGVRLRNCIIEDSVEIKDYTIAENTQIKSGSKIGPFAHLRPDTLIGKNCRVGNFVEIKKSVLKDGTKAAHLSYIGDAEIGKNVNIGAGTITCNYDGTKKHKTIIEDNVFVGSDSQLVAPVKINKDAYIAAGSTITKEVPEGCLAISRVPQRHIEGWSKKKIRKT